ncbi:MAG: type I restriction endonuclease, partial [Bacteroidetes bacterium]|nr:type I restriction endonuclease [Bacteroidota bacterium]
MGLRNDLEGLSTRYEEYRNTSISEAKTEAFFVRPFLRSLGYESSNPELVDPQYLADPHDIKTGKVDYALLRNGEPIIFVEAKKLHQSLDTPETINQIKRYFNNVLEVDFVILTNGNEYRFFTDLY